MYIAMWCNYCNVIDKFSAIRYCFYNFYNHVVLCGIFHYYFCYYSFSAKWYYCYNSSIEPCAIRPIIIEATALLWATRYTLLVWFGTALVYHYYILHLRKAAWGGKGWEGTSSFGAPFALPVMQLLFQKVIYRLSSSVFMASVPRSLHRASNQRQVVLRLI